MTLVIIYMVLLLAGIVCFFLHYLAVFRIARQLQRQHPEQWQIVAASTQRRLSLPQLWLRMQSVLRSPALPAMQDKKIDRWRLIWRLSFWLAWLSWIGAVALQWQARH